MLNKRADTLRSECGKRINRYAHARNLQWLSSLVAGLMFLVGPGCSKENKPASSEADPKSATTPASTPTGVAKANTSTPAPTASTSATSEEVYQVPRPDGGKLIHVDNADHNFGSVWVGDTLKHTFKISNVGDTLLEISNVKPSCGCTVAGSYPKQLKPGESGEFPFSLNSAKLKSGQFTKTVNISSNDSTKPVLKLTLKGVCKRIIDTEPANANFSTIDGATEHERVVKIRNNGKQPLELEILPVDDKRLAVELKETQPGEEFELHIKIVPPVDPGMISTVVKLKTNSEKQKELAIRIFARIPKRIDVTPASVTFRKVPNSTRDQIRILRLNNYGKTPVNLLWARVDDPKVEITTKEIKAGKAYTITVKASPDYEVPKEGKTIVIKTDDAEQPEIKVPMRSSIARAPTKRPAELMVGKPIPTFDQLTIDQKPVKSTELNQVTVLNFFAVNCPHCMRQLPKVEKMRPEYEAKGVRFVNVSQTMRKKEFTEDQVRAKLASLGVESEIVTNPDNSFGLLFSATSYPTMVILGKSGKIEAVNVGNNAALEAKLKAQLTKLLATN